MRWLPQPRGGSRSERDRRRTPTACRRTPPRIKVNCWWMPPWPQPISTTRPTCICSTRPEPAVNGFLDQLWETVRQPGQRKPRTYRQQARRNFLTVAKKRRPTRRQIRKAIGQQLRYLRRNLEQIRQLVAAGARLEVLSGFWYQRLLVIQEVYRQQADVHPASTPGRPSHRQLSATPCAPHRAG
jgi:hypothetical protein